MNTRNIIMVVVALLLAIAASVIIFSLQQPPAAPTDTSAPPAVTPTTSSPEGALSSCIDQNLGDSCYFIIGGTQHEGECRDVMGVLTCGPKRPAQQ